MILILHSLVYSEQKAFCRRVHRFEVKKSQWLKKGYFHVFQSPEKQWLIWKYLYMISNPSSIHQQKEKTVFQNLVEK